MTRPVHWVPARIRMADDLVVEVEVDYWQQYVTSAGVLIYRTRDEHGEYDHAIAAGAWKGFHIGPYDHVTVYRGME